MDFNVFGVRFRAPESALATNWILRYFLRLQLSNIDLLSCYPNDGAFEDDVAQNLASQSRYVGRNKNRRLKAVVLTRSPLWKLVVGKPLFFAPI